MYILGFALIFVGLSLFLYYFVQRFAGRGRPDADLEPIVQAESIRFPVESRSASDLTADLAAVAPARDSKAQDMPGEIRPELEKSSGVTAPSPVEERPLLDLFIAGYLYVDAKRSTAGYLDRPDQSPPETMAEMSRLGQATLRWWNGAFQFDHGAGLIVVPESRLKEIRFSPGGAIFVPATSDLPIVYLFTVEAQAIREFLSLRSR